MFSNDKSLSVLVGPATVRVKRYGHSRITVANILGCDSDASDGVTRIYLDRLVHSRTDVAPEGWAIAGAITTILEPPSGFRLPSSLDVSDL